MSKKLINRNTNYTPVTSSQTASPSVINQDQFPKITPLHHRHQSISPIRVTANRLQKSLNTQISQKNIEPHDQISINLSMIFKQYARLSACQSKQHHYTFDQVNKEYQSLKLGAFIKFCKDFSLPIKLATQIQVFNRAYERTLNQHSLADESQISGNGSLNFYDFQSALSMCFNASRYETIQKLQLEAKRCRGNNESQQKIKVIKQKLNEIKNEEIDDFETAVKYLKVDQYDTEQMMLHLNTLRVYEWRNNLTQPQDKPPLHPISTLVPGKMSIQRRNIVLKRQGLKNRQSASVDQLNKSPQTANINLTLKTLDYDNRSKSPSDVASTPIRSDIDYEHNQSQNSKIHIVEDFDPTTNLKLKQKGKHYFTISSLQLMKQSEWLKKEHLNEDEDNELSQLLKPAQFYNPTVNEGLQNNECFYRQDSMTTTQAAKRFLKIARQNMTPVLQVKAKVQQVKITELNKVSEVLKSSTSDKVEEILPKIAIVPASVSVSVPCSIQEPPTPTPVIPAIAIVPDSEKVSQQVKEEQLLEPLQSAKISRQKTKNSYIRQITRKSTRSRFDRLKSKNLAAHFDLDWIVKRKNSKHHVSEFDSLLDNQEIQDVSQMDEESDMDDELIDK